MDPVYEPSVLSVLNYCTVTNTANWQTRDWTLPRDLPNESQRWDQQTGVLQNTVLDPGNRANSYQPNRNYTEDMIGHTQRDLDNVAEKSWPNGEPLASGGHPTHIHGPAQRSTDY